MEVLQISCGFNYSRVYQQLFSEFEKKELPFCVYIPQHKGAKTVNIPDLPFRAYSNVVIKPYDKVLYYTKIRRMVKDIEQNFDMDNISLMHAHSLFSDGAVAYELYKKYNIPYIVAVRNTDVNKYFKYALHLRKYAMNIIKNAKKVIYISHSYKQLVIDKYIHKSYKNEVNNKSQVIPNGIDDYWHYNSKHKNRIDDNNIRLIFVGAINKNKNLETVIKLTKYIQTKGMNISLKILGTGPLYQELKEKYKKDSKIEFFGKVEEKERIIDLYNKSDILIVPSITETFGLVYVEAMSCGIPIIYTKGQGFDGYFRDGEVGYKTDPYDIEKMYESVTNILNDYKSISKNCHHSIEQFKWKCIAEKYINLYNNM